MCWRPTEKRIKERAEAHGIQCDTWAPGDGVRRYRFISARYPRDYFSAADCERLATCMGARDAWEWISAFGIGRRMGLHTDRRSDVCPQCGTDGAIGESVEISDTEAQQECSCTACDAVWLQVYTIERPHIIDRGRSHTAEFKARHGKDGA